MNELEYISVIEEAGKTKKYIYLEIKASSSSPNKVKTKRKKKINVF